MSKSLVKAVFRAKIVKGHGSGVVWCVVCGKTNYTAKLKVFRVKVLSVAKNKYYQIIKITMQKYFNFLDDKILRNTLRPNKIKFLKNKII